MWQLWGKEEEKIGDWAHASPAVTSSGPWGRRSVNPSVCRAKQRGHSRAGKQQCRESTAMVWVCLCVYVVEVEVGWMITVICIPRCYYWLTPKDTHTQGHKNHNPLLHTHTDTHTHTHTHRHSHTRFQAMNQHCNCIPYRANSNSMMYTSSSSGRRLGNEQILLRCELNTLSSPHTSSHITLSTSLCSAIYLPAFGKRHVCSPIDWPSWLCTLLPVSLPDSTPRELLVPGVNVLLWGLRVIKRSIRNLEYVWFSTFVTEFLYLVMVRIRFQSLEISPVL